MLVHICMRSLVAVCVRFWGARWLRETSWKIKIHMYACVCPYVFQLTALRAAAATEAANCGWFCIHNANTHTNAYIKRMLLGRGCGGWGRPDSKTYDERNSCKLRSSRKSSGEAVKLLQARVREKGRERALQVPASSEGETKKESGEPAAVEEIEWECQ